MKYLILLMALIGSSLQAQTPTTAAMVLGCSNPAPAAVGQPTIFISKCTAPVFVPTTTTSVLASVSKTAPVWAHTFAGYKTTDMLIACPAGAVVSGATCTSGGKDVSSLVQQSVVAAFSITLPPPSCPATFVSVNWTCTVSTDGKTASCTAPISP